jgi:Carboxypeptidase regulatory-like domain/TonB dependent receptor/TonB-dependent Receptor Plug Domain
MVADSSGRVITGAAIIVVNDVTGIKYAGSTNAEGIYVMPNLPPGPYRLQVSKPGFKTLVKPDILLNVQDALSINFTLPVGALSETVTVEGGAPLVNTQSAAVSTVVDRRFIERLPLNGRSFNTLLQLTPGIVIAPSRADSPGQFSIAGQRTDANNFTIDGVSADFGVAALPVLGTSGTGAGQAFSALGGTSSLVSVEGLQEFRAETSSSGAEFGRNSGGQVLLTTRSGTNDFHAGIYEYFRNDAMDANDWFANNTNQPRAPERHNDFGAYFGGPFARNKSFFFFSYEGARLRLPQTTVVTVPSTSSRQLAPAALAPFLNAYPQPNGPATGDGSTAQFTGSYSNRASLNAGSVRIDHNVNQRLSIFGRYNQAPSEIIQRLNALNELQAAAVNTRTLTVGANFVPSERVANITRVNLSQQSAHLSATLDNFGGASLPPASELLSGLSPGHDVAGFFAIGTNLYQSGPLANNRSRQFNVVDDLSIASGVHQMRLGGDYRAIILNDSPAGHSILYIAPSVSAFITSGQANMSANTARQGSVLANALSLYALDNWKVTPRLTLTYGLRWELNPAPDARNGTLLASWLNVQDPARLTLAPDGTPVWHTVYHNVAPRLGLAYRITDEGDLVLRLGGGVFYDLGLGSSANLLSRFPNFASTFSPNVLVPVNNANTFVPGLSLNPPFSTAIEAFSPELKAPRSYQWNLAVEKSFGGRQALSATYVGQAGRDLLRQSALFAPNPTIAGVFLLTGNDAFSNYHALQLQYRRPVSERLQALVNYTWSHSLDNASDDVVAGLSNTVISGARDYGNSAFDVRHSFSAGLTFEPPAIKNSKPLGRITTGWSIDSVVVARSGFPFNLQVLSTSPDASGTVPSRPDVVAGQPVWISDPSAPAGRRINPAAFAVPTTIRQGTETRNDIAGLNLVQIDVSVGRRFSLGGRRMLQFRVDGFNIFNHPNFTNPSAFLEFGPSFLQSSRMLNQGLGGLNPLFQTGGPRSLQIALKLTM